jgi:hypothetical protein
MKFNAKDPNFAFNKFFRTLDERHHNWERDQRFKVHRHVLF